MKKLFVAILALIIVGGAAFYACQKESSRDVLSPKGKTLKFLNSSLEEWRCYGELHNAFMENAVMTFKNEIEFENVNEILDYVTEVNLDFVEKYSVENFETKIFRENLQYHKSLIYIPNLHHQLFSQDNGIILQVNQLHDWTVIDDFEKKKLDEILIKIESNLSGNITNDEFIVFMNDVTTEYSTHYLQGEQTEKQGQFLGVILAISSASIEFWDENSDQVYVPYDDGGCYAAPIVANDVAGAVIGGAISGVASYATSGSVDWGGVAIGAAAGAIDGSCGVVAKAGSALYKGACWLVSKLF